MQIRIISWEEIYPIWNSFLWPSRNCNDIKPISAMLYNGEIDIGNYKYRPIFFGLYHNNKLIGVNSGHKCCDNTYRSRGLWVDKNYRGMNLGVELLLACVNKAEREKAIFLWSLPRKTSKYVYEKAGFYIRLPWIKTDTFSHNAYAYYPII